MYHRQQKVGKEIVRRGRGESMVRVKNVKVDLKSKEFDESEETNLRQ